MTKGKPKMDGSGRGRRANRGRRGCATTRRTGRGKKGCGRFSRFLGLGIRRGWRSGRR